MQYINKIWFYATIVALMILSGCTKNEFNTSFKLSAEDDHTYTLLYYASDSRQGWVVENAVAISGGIGEFKGITRNPTLVYILGGRQLPLAIFYAERGDHIKFTGKGSDPAQWKIEGNKLSEELYQWLNTNADILAAGDYAKINGAVEKYIRSNPENPASTILLLVYFTRRDNEAGFRNCYKMLKGEASEGKWKELVARTDMLEEYFPSLTFPKNIVLHTAATGRDTISTGRVPMILYFTRNSVGTYREDIAELRKLTRQFSDSTKRIIADISFEPDSGARYYPVRYDSLEKVVRAWMPLGVCDSTARKIGVCRVPYFMVIDKSGKIRYRGDERSKASSEFEKLMK